MPDDAWEDPWGDTWEDAWAQRLDDLLSGRSEPTPADKPLRDLLYAATAARNLRDAEPDPAFVRELLELGGVEPRPEFTRDLFEQMVAESARLAQPAARPATLEEPVAVALKAPKAPKAPKETNHFMAPTAPPDRLPKRVWDGARRRRLLWQVAAVALVLFCLAGSLALASQATPNSPLFGLRRLERSAQLQLALDPAARAQARIGAAQDALAALEYVITQHDTPTYRENLSDFQSAYTAARDAVASVSSHEQRAGLETTLDAIQAQAITDLHQALANSAWADRLTTTATLRALGAATPTITQVIYTHTTNGANGVTLRITGSGFLAGATLCINGRPAGEVRSVTASAIQAELPGVAALDPGATVGVSNPDGTAAQFTLASGG